MINRLSPAGIAVIFGAKQKNEPGEISRVKSSEEYSSDNKLEKSPKFDTFTASVAEVKDRSVSEEELEGNRE